MKRNFVRFISHEMRTPLNAATMGLRLVQKGLTGNTSRGDLLATLKEVDDACEISVGILEDIWRTTRSVWGPCSWSM